MRSAIFNKSDYYDQNRTVEGQCLGRGAELLGLRGDVGSKDFEAVRQGFDPQAEEFLRQRHSADRIDSNGEEQSKAHSLYDMTFSAPKSVSIMATVGGDERLIGAHETAVREALEEAEKYSASKVRLAGLNENRTTGNWLVAAYTHDTRRELDRRYHQRPGSNFVNPSLYARCVSLRLNWLENSYPRTLWKSGMMLTLCLE